MAVEQLGINTDLALMCGFLLATCLLLAFIAWTCMNYVEDDLERFNRWVHNLPER
jgi:hypothetical protein